jgi:hypothetical protein
MRISRWTLLLPLAAACSNDVPTDNFGDPASREIAPGGAITGTMTYQGPHPCSANGHIVGNGVVLLFDQRVPPPPAGLAATAVNFAVVVGDALFPNEPRWGGSDTYCPEQHGIYDTITTSAPFQVGPLAPASYIIQSFYDYTGDFLPTFKFRELPEKGDIGGGDIDLSAALQPINQNPNYMPTFEPIAVGVPQPNAADAAPGTIPLYTIPPQGFVAQNVQVTVGKSFTTTRPYFYAEGLNAVSTTMGTGTFATVSQTVTEAQSSAQYWGASGASCPTMNCNGGSKTLIQNSQEFAAPSNGSMPDPAHYAPILTIPQDIQTFAPPTTFLAGSTGANKFESGGTTSTGQVLSGLPHLRLRWEGSDSRQQQAASQPPFNMQLTPFSETGPSGGFSVWQGQWLNPNGVVHAPGSDAGVPGPVWTGQYIPDSVYKQANGAPLPLLWPLVILSKLVDDPSHTLDPASLTAQGDATHPVVIMQGITLWGGGTPMTSGNQDNDSLFTLGGALQPLITPVDPFVDSNGNPVIFVQDHVTALLRPAVICFNTLFDANNSDKRGNLVTPYLVSESTDQPPFENVPIVPVDLLNNGDPNRQQVGNLVKAPPGWTEPAGWTPGAAPPSPPSCSNPDACGPAIRGCLPKGRYAINVVYPDGQAWTVPNEAGACTGTSQSGEGVTDWNNYTCTLQKRTVIQSQGPRAVVEIVGPSNPKNCVDANSPVPPTPAICMPTSGN